MSKIWTLIVKFISNDHGHYATYVSCQSVRKYVHVDMYIEKDKMEAKYMLGYLMIRFILLCQCVTTSKFLSEYKNITISRKNITMRFQNPHKTLATHFLLTFKIIECYKPISQTIKHFSRFFLKKIHCMT